MTSREKYVLTCARKREQRKQPRRHSVMCVRVSWGWVELTAGLTRPAPHGFASLSDLGL